MDRVLLRVHFLDLFRLADPAMLQLNLNRCIHSAIKAQKGGSIDIYRKRHIKQLSLSVNRIKMAKRGGVNMNIFITHQTSPNQLFAGPQAKH